MSSQEYDTPVAVEELKGEVVLLPYGHGTKSERTALMLKTKDGHLLIRRRGGPSFGETGLESWVGKRVRCWGTLLSNVMLVDRIADE